MIWGSTIFRNPHLDLQDPPAGGSTTTRLRPLRNLDHRVDTPDARITNDTDLLLQFLFEFVFGGQLGKHFWFHENLTMKYDESLITGASFGTP